MLNFLKGKKSFIMAGCLALSTFAYAVGWIDSHVYSVLVGLFTSGGIASLKAGQLGV